MVAAGRRRVQGQVQLLYSQFNVGGTRALKTGNVFELFYCSNHTLTSWLGPG